MTLSLTLNYSCLYPNLPRNNLIMHSGRRAPEWVAPCQVGLGLPQCSLGKGCLETSFLKSKSHLERSGLRDPAWAAQISMDLHPPLSLAPESTDRSPASCLPAGLLCSAPGQAPEPLNLVQATPSTAPDCGRNLFSPCSLLDQTLLVLRPCFGQRSSLLAWRSGPSLSGQTSSCPAPSVAHAQGQPLPQEEHGAG